MHIHHLLYEPVQSIIAGEFISRDLQLLFQHGRLMYLRSLKYGVDERKEMRLRENRTTMRDQNKKKDSA